MSEVEVGSFTFVVRIWIEQTTEEIQGGMWRGRVLCLPEHEERYVHSLAEITALIERHLRLRGLAP